MVLVCVVFVVFHQIEPTLAAWRGALGKSVNPEEGLFWRRSGIGTAYFHSITQSNRTGRNDRSTPVFKHCMSRSALGIAPKTQAAGRRGPPKPPTRTARGLHDQPEEPVDESDLHLQVWMAVTNAQMVWSELLVSNGGGRPSKREELEVKLDRQILILSQLLKRIKRARLGDPSAIMNTLRILREYRLRFPRSNPAKEEMSKQACKVLNSLR